MHTENLGANTISGVLIGEYQTEKIWEEMALLYIHIVKYIQGIFCCFLELNHYFHGSIILYIQNYKHACDIFNVYKLYKVKAQESSWRCYSLREKVGLECRVVSGSDLIPLQYVFKDLVNI